MHSKNTHRERITDQAISRGNEPHLEVRLNQSFYDRQLLPSYNLLRMAISKSVMHFARVPLSHQFHQRLFLTQSNLPNQSRYNIFRNRL